MSSRSGDGCVTVVVGIQWGDEGKGRIVDVLARDAEVVARFSGGDNAGHTLVVGDRKLALRVVPSGVMVPHTRLLIGSGTVVSLPSLIDELDMLGSIGVDVSRVSISDRAHVVFPYHIAADRLGEKLRGGAAIGTTGRGIGPAYVDRVGRVGITFGDLRRPVALADKIRQNLIARAAAFAAAGASESLPREEDLISQALDQSKRIVPHVVDGVGFMHEALENGRRIIAEGAQGTMLDVTYGTYPYVTSSNTIAGAATLGLGIGPRTIGRVIGIAKAYCSRVGGGPFPSELTDETGERLRKVGAEFGTVTGRPRRCGWFDAVAARYAVRLNGLDSIALTKLDVLTGLEKIGVVTGYKRDGAQVGIEAIGEPGFEVEIEWHEGWSEDLGPVREITKLPPAARRYVAALESLLGVPIEQVSVGPERSMLAK